LNQRPPPCEDGALPLSYAPERSGEGIKCATVDPVEQAARQFPDGLASTRSKR
jgi:hypothetical protein